ncbi:MAG: alpha-ketoacid dehydrogenase subunit beta [Hyphomonadaceae bacterium]|nr:alpha-ketoacid dehydrogenase subunit beta [Hyphomonadaceae bacterium]MBC6413147.1 alpha-ketoacid dehydrogenase subunit beta [Hyphomonadaceae bacterium]
MASMNMIEAVRDAMDVKMSQDPDVLVFGEDVGYFGGVFRCTAGLQKKHGLHRCFDTPISEGGIIGIAIGMAAYGLRPVTEIQFADYIYPAYDQIASEAARIRFRSNGQFTVPLTIRTPVGGGIYGGQTHSQSPEALFTHIAGLKTVIPSNPYDAKGLLITAIEDNDPVLFLEPKRLYNGPFGGDPHAPAGNWGNHELGDVPADHYRIEFGSARRITDGDDLTILAYGTMVWIAEQVARDKGISADILDLRSLLPLDINTIEESVKRTGRCVVLHEATRTSGFGAELVTQVQEQCFYSLEAPIERVTGWDTPYPHAQERAYFPGPKRIGLALERVLRN